MKHKDIMASAPLTKTQLGLYIDSIRDPQKAVYHTPHLIRLPGIEDARELAEALRKVVAAFPAMSAGITTDAEGEPVMTVAVTPIPIEEVSMSEQELLENPEKLVAPFDFDGSHLGRLKVISAGGSVYLFYDFHHTLFDGASHKMMLRALDAACRGEQIEPEKLTIFDVAAKERELRSTDALQSARLEYEEMLSGCDPSFDILPDLSPADRQGEESYSVVEVTLPVSTDEYKEYCRRENLPQSVAATAAMGVTLQVFSRRDDVTFATIYHGRKDEETASTFGLMVKTLPVRVNTDGSTTIGELLSRTATSLASARRGDLYSFAEAAADFGVNSDFLFAFQGGFLQLPAINGVKPVEIPVSKLSTGSKITASLFYTETSLRLSIEYRSDLFSAPLMSTLASTFAHQLMQMMTLPSSTPLTSLSLVGADELARVMKMSDGGPSEAVAGTTVPMLFRETARRCPDKTAVRFNDVAITFGELDEMTDRLASLLRNRYGVGRETIVGVLIERSELMAVFPLAVMKAGGAYMPLDPHFPADRLMFMTEDAGVALILADDGLADRVMPDYKGEVITRSDIRTLPEATGDIPDGALPGSAMAVLYTSGSTGKPKGVILEQRGVVNYVAAYRHLTSMTDEDIVGAYAAFGFDAHIMDMYPTLISGATLHIFNSEIRLDLTAMHDYMVRERISVIFMTTQIVWQMATLFDFPSMRVLCGGGEKLPPLGPLPYTFFNLYGPTECSVIATAYRLEGTTDGKDIGKPIAGYKVRIVDRYLRMLPVGITGELLILGECVGRGYLNRPELNEEKFIEIDGERAYRTGDHGRFIPCGDIEFAGRIDGLVKLRGLRIELGEIDAVASRHPKVKSFAAAVKKIGSMENLAGYFTVREGETLSADELRDHMRESLTEFMVPEILMQLDSMPLTPNGKIDRRRLPVPEMKEVEIVQPSGESEKEIFDIVAEVLGHSDFGVTTNLLSAGLTSLMAMRLVAAIIKKTGVRISAKTVMSAPTVREIAPKVAEGGEEKADGMAATAPSAPRRRYYPLTENQRGIYIDWEMNREALQYNIPQAFMFGEGTDAGRLRQAVVEVIKAHPGLLTRLVVRNGDVMQERHDDCMADISITDLDKAPDAAFFQSRIRPFNLLSDPLFRCEIFRYAGRVYMLVDAHHIIFDGVSAMVFLDSLRRAYAGEELQAEELSALDNAVRESEILESDLADKADEWFSSLVADSESTSYPRSQRPDNDIAGGMGRIRFSIASGPIRQFCAANGITLSNYLMSAFLQLLHRIVREQTIQITTVNNGRSDVRLLSSTGMFVKTLPVVSRVVSPGDVTPAGHAHEIQQQFLTTQDFDFYPFTKLVEKRGVRPEIMYVYEGGIDLSGGGSSCGLTAEKIPLALDTAKVPLTLLVFEKNDGDLELVLEYDTSLYGVDDMTVLLRMTGNLALSLPQAATLADGVMTDAAQRAQLDGIRYGKRCDVPYESMHGEMERQADMHPSATALVACDKTMTYLEFDNECNRIANALIRRGVGHGDRIVILLPRRSSLITAIYGTMKTGSAYIPCDPDYPAERIRLITEDSGARYIITTPERVGLYDNAVSIDDLLEETDTHRPGVKVSMDDVAYMIYTSGSTGRPKGVMIPQRGITNYLYGYYDMNYRDRDEVKVEMLLVTISFDASLNNLGVSLTCGHTLVLADEEECKDVVMLSKLMLDNKVDSFDITPSRLDAMLDLPEFRKAIARCSHINIGGEGFQTALVAKLFDAGFHGKAINEYGPTETTVGSNRSELTPYTPVVAGPPFYNDTQRITDAWGGELPVGAVGELLISGRGLGLGYNNLPEKTAEAYIDYKGERAYRTGDLARWTPQGDVVILGRIDHQVKLRGLRIELGEIEAVALRFDGIGKVAANVCEVNRIQHLCLYYTGKGIDRDALQRHLADCLTEYMVPDAYVEIQEMPLTPNGKTNRKALPLPEIARAAEYVEPEGKIERLIADAFTSVLGNDRTGADDDFFAIGGTSISAIKVVAALALSGYSITYKNVFAARTPRALAEIINGKKPDAAAVCPTEKVLASGDVARSEFADLLERNTLDAFLTGRRQEFENVLLTGATGFMGIHILRELIVSHSCNVVCMLRRSGDIEPESRLRTLLFYYFDNTFEEEFASGRIRVVEGDVTKAIPSPSDLGLMPDMVINCAANVKHFSAGNDIELVNVESVRNLIAFCRESGARMVHVSTISIAGESVNGYPDPSLLLTERMLDFGQSLANQYVSSKYEAERLIMSAIRDSGLNAKIMRVGNLSARGSDGEFQINFRSNAFMGKLRAYVALGCAPYDVLDAPCEFSPIDEVCRAILLLSSTPRDMIVFQPCNNHRLPLGDVLHILGETGHTVAPVETDVFQKAQKEAMDDAVKVNALQPLLAYASDRTSRTTFIRYDASFTNQILYRLGFRWNYTSHDYVERFLRAIDSLDFFRL